MNNVVYKTITDLSKPDENSGTNVRTERARRDYRTYAGTTNPTIKLRKEDHQNDGKDAGKLLHCWLSLIDFI